MQEIATEKLKLQVSET